MFAVLEHIVRVHRRMDEGLENEVVVVLFVSSVICYGERMDDENRCLFESLQEVIDVFGREVRSPLDGEVRYSVIASW